MRGCPAGGPGSVSAAARAAAPASPSSGPLRAAMLVDYDDDAPIIGPPPPGQSSGDEEARASGSRGGAGDGASPTNLVRCVPCDRDDVGLQFGHFLFADE